MDKLTFEADGRRYGLRFSLGVIEQIETETGTPLLAQMQQHGGLLPVAALRTYVSYALAEQPDGRRVPLAQAQGMAEQLIERSGYAAVCALVGACLQRDCPFFFRAA